jgi:tetratricopeptide (TPR) repeat protein
MMDLALTLAELGDADADAMYSGAVSSLEWLVHEAGRPEYERMLASAYGNFANVVRNRDAPAAIQLYDRAVEILERLYYVEKDWGVAEHLAVVWLDKATLLASSQDANALDLNGRGIGLLEGLVESGQVRLRHTLCKALVNYGAAAVMFGLSETAIAKYDEAIAKYRELIGEGASDDIIADYAWAIANRGRTIRQFQGDHGLADIARALQVLEPAAARTGRGELAGMVQMLKKELGV